MLNSWALANGYDPYKVGIRKLHFCSSGGVTTTLERNHSPADLDCPLPRSLPTPDDNIQEIAAATSIVLLSDAQPN